MESMIVISYFKLKIFINLNNYSFWILVATNKRKVDCKKCTAECIYNLDYVNPRYVYCISGADTIKELKRHGHYATRKVQDARGIQVNRNVDMARQELFNHYVSIHKKTSNQTFQVPS